MAHASPEITKRRNNLLFWMLTINAALCYCIGLLLFISKWFPYGRTMMRIREWLYAFF
jgi:hypothetical protein